mgnify:CR=1 FL=1
MKESNYKKILLGHGSGGKLTHELIQDILAKKLHNKYLSKLSDSAVLPLRGGELAFTTDSFVVTPLFFPGADIGKLAVCGTVNDLVVQGALPRYLSLAFIVEEGLSFDILNKVVDSIALACRQAKIMVVTGDFKVVPKLACDQMFINTSGIGEMVSPMPLSTKRIKEGDEVLVTGNIGEHGLAILSARNDLDLKIKSDCALLSELLCPISKKFTGVMCMRDPTRGGLATTLNELAFSSGKTIRIYEEKIPISPRARVAAELLGVDLLYMACEGRAIIITDHSETKAILRQLRNHTLGKNSAIIGEVVRRGPAEVLLQTSSGSQRILDMPVVDMLPRIC